MEKPGYKTSEFWLSLLAMIVGTLMASGIWAEGDMLYRVLAFAASALAALGYTVSRSRVKAAEAFASRPVIEPEVEAQDP